MAKKPRAMAEGAFVVLVDDELPIRKLVTTVLSANGYEVLSFSNGKAAVAWIKSNPRRIDLLITDIKMPEMTGKDMADEICSLRPEIKILFISGSAAYQFADLNPGANTGDFFLAKPFHPSELLAKVEGALLPDPENRAARIDIPE